MANTNESPKGYDQRVTQPDNWLTDWNGTFVKVIHLPEGQRWPECTNDEKEQWEQEHQPDEQDDQHVNLTELPGEIV